MLGRTLTSKTVISWDINNCNSNENKEQEARTSPLNGKHYNKSTCQSVWQAPSISNKLPFDKGTFTCCAIE